MFAGRQVLIAILLTAVAGLLFLAATAWRRRAAAGPAGVYLALSMLAMAIYNFGYAFEIASNTLSDIMFWVRFQHWGIQTIAPTWVLFALCIAGKEKLITTPRIVLLGSPAMLFLLAGQTLGGANLTHINPRLNMSGPFPTFTYDRGLIAWLNVSFVSACLALGFVIFLIMLVRAAPAFRKQAAIFLGGSLISWLGTLLYMLGLTPYNLDFTPLSLSLSAVILMFGVFKYRMLDIMPLARDVVFEGMREGVLVLDTSNRVIDYNPRLQTLLPAIHERSVGVSVFEALKAYPALLEMLKNEATQVVELQLGQTEASPRYEGHISPLINRRKQLVGKLITLHDHAEIQRLLQQLEEIASHDDLTGAFNRRHFGKLATSEIERLKRYGGALSLVMFDLDFYKTVNDTYGHAAGDMALREVVDICRATQRRTDILGRLGGDEFLLLLPHTTLHDAAGVAERLRTAIATHTMHHSGQAFSVTASFGVTAAGGHKAVTLDDLYRYADQAVYAAKESGRNRVCTHLPAAPG